MSVPQYDVVVIGAGINGAGIAQAAAAAGYSVLLLEKSAPAAGTSSKSSKLVHGGLRYLESYEFGLVRESLRERALLLKLAPELVQLQEFCIPVYRSTRRPPVLLHAGLSLYWALTGLSRDGRYRTVPRQRWGELDGIRQEGLRAVFSYSDARTDDSALTRAVVQSAVELGAEFECPAHFWGAELHASGSQVHYRSQSKEQSCAARVVVNAAGPWANEAMRLVQPAPELLPVDLVQGTHIEMPGFAGPRFYYLESPRDGRAVFVMPREGRLVIGTTEKHYKGHPDDVTPTHAEENYLLNVLHHYFPELGHLGRQDMLCSWAGLRVLPGGKGKAFRKSRETILHTDRTNKPRWLTVYGGKLTTYRTTAEKVVERISSGLPERRSRGSTRELALRPAD